MLHAPAPSQWPLTSASDGLDRDLMWAVLQFSSSEPARLEAAAWLAAFETARTRGASTSEAAAAVRTASDADDRAPPDLPFRRSADPRVDTEVRKQ